MGKRIEGIPHVITPRKINLGDPSTYTAADIDRLPLSEKIELAKRNIRAVTERVQREPEFFVFTFARTLDPHNPTEPIRKFPEKQYLKELIRIWWQSKLLIIAKSRQLMASWLFITLHYWLAAYHPGQFVFFQSKKEEDADALLDRANIVHMNLPEWITPPGKKTYCWFDFSSIHSKIQAVSQSSDAIRSQTASAIFSDEVGFQPYARDAYAAAKPTIDGGGRWTGVSTPNGKEFFYNMYSDLE